jgi:hypothetical protein
VRWRIHGVCQNAENFADSNVSGENFTKTRLAAVLASEGFFPVFSGFSPVFSVLDLSTLLLSSLRSLLFRASSALNLD